MRALSIFRTQAFRIVHLYLGVFAASATALVAFVYGNTTLVLERESDETIGAEVTGLAEQYSRLGIPGLTDVIVGRSIRGGQGLYLLARPDLHVIAGNLDAWPRTAAWSVASDFGRFSAGRRSTEFSYVRATTTT